MKKPNKKTLVTIGDKMAVASSEVVRLDEVKDGPVHQPPISAETLKLIKEHIMEPLAEVYPLTLEQWEDGFRRDANPNKEIALWSAIAKSYKDFLASNALGREQKMEVLGLAVARSACPSRDEFLKGLKLKLLSRAQVETIAALLEKNWEAGAWRTNERKRLSQN